MKKIITTFQLLFTILLLNSCKSLIMDKTPVKEPEEVLNEESNSSENSKMEIRFSCGEEGLKKYLDDGWIIVEETSQEKICTWKSFPATKDCDMEKDKGCKITKPDQIGEEVIYILEKK